MIVKKHAVSVDLAKVISQVVIRATELTAREIEAELDRIRRTFLLATKSKRTRLETRRRIAEWKFKLLVEGNSAAQDIQKRYLAVRRLGFSDKETEATIKIYLAQYHIRRSRPRDAHRVLLALNKKLGTSSATEHLRQDAARLLAGLSR